MRLSTIALSVLGLSLSLGCSKPEEGAAAPSSAEGGAAAVAVKAALGEDDDDDDDAPYVVVNTKELSGVKTSERYLKRLDEAWSLVKRGEDPTIPCAGVSGWASMSTGPEAVAAVVECQSTIPIFYLNYKLDEIEKGEFGCGDLGSILMMRLSSMLMSPDDIKAMRDKQGEPEQAAAEGIAKLMTQDADAKGQILSAIKERTLKVCPDLNHMFEDVK